MDDCPEEPIAVGGSRPFEDYFPYHSNLFEAPYDPAPGAPGVWLGAGVSRSACFSTIGGDATASDRDRDGLADSCEFSLARSFAPMLSFHPSEDCVGAEPHWAAKRFYDGTVNIGYLVSYYRDCGYPGSPGQLYDHNGDSELITVQVHFNSETQHWETLRLWTSAHWGTASNRSRWTETEDIYYHTRERAYPVVFVAENKHANYPDVGCEQWGVVGEWCGGYDTQFWGRTPVLSWRNVGSRYVDLVGCKRSERLSTSRTECFYTLRKFGGWLDFIDDLSTPYRDILFGDQNFEYQHEPATGTIEDPDEEECTTDMDWCG